MATDYDDDLLATDPEFQARIDDLVSSALEDQAREKRFLMEMVSAAKAALSKAEHELGALRQIVEHRDESVVDLLEARLAGLGTERSIEDLGSKINMMLERPPVDELVVPITQRIADLTGQLDEIHKGLKPLDPWPAAIEIQRTIAERVESRLQPIADALEDIRTETAALIRSASDQVSDRLSHRLNAAEEALAGDVDVMQEAVVQRLDVGIERSSTNIISKLGEAVDHLSSGIDGGMSEVAAELDSRLSQMKEALSEISVQLESAVWASAQKVESGLDSVAEKLDAGLTSTTEAIQTGNAELAEKLQTGNAELAEKLQTGNAELAEKLQTDNAELAERVQTGNAELANEVRGGMSDVTERLSSGLADIDTKLETGVSSLSDTVDSGVIALSEKLDSSLRQITTDVEGLGERVDDELRTRLSAVSESLIRLRADLSEMFRTGHEELSETIVTAAQQLLSKTEGSISELQGALHLVHQSGNAKLFDRFLQLEAELVRMNGAIAEIPASLEAGLEDLQTFTAQREHDLREAIHSFGQTIDKGEQNRSEILGDQLSRISSSIDAYQPAVGRAVHDAITPFVEEVRALGERVRQTNRRITESNSRLEAMHESLIAYLSNRDERLERVREKSVIDMFAQLEETLNAKERAKLAGAMKLARQRRQDRKDAERYRRMKAGSKPVSDAERELILEEMAQSRIASKQAPTEEILEMPLSTPTPPLAATAVQGVVKPPKPAPKMPAKRSAADPSPVNLGAKTAKTPVRAKATRKVAASVTQPKTSTKKAAGKAKPAPKAQRKRAV